MPFSHLIFWCPRLFLPSIFPSIRDFSNESAVCIRWPKYWGFSISPSNEFSGLISLKIDWTDLLAVQGILRSLFQSHNSKASILQHSAFIVQLSHPYMTTRKSITLTIQTFVGNIYSVLKTCKFIADVDRFGDCTYECRFSVLLTFTLYWSIVD